VSGVKCRACVARRDVVRGCGVVAATQDTEHGEQALMVGDGVQEDVASKQEEETKHASAEATEEAPGVTTFMEDFWQSFTCNIKQLWKDSDSVAKKGMLVFGVTLALPVAAAIAGLLGLAGVLRTGTRCV
jgi:hypothetical protein